MEQPQEQDPYYGNKGGNIRSTDFKKLCLLTTAKKYAGQCQNPISHAWLYEFIPKEWLAEWTAQRFYLFYTVGFTGVYELRTQQRAYKARSWPSCYYLGQTLFN